MCFTVNQSFDQFEAITNSATQGNSTPVGMIEKNTRLPGYHRQITSLITYQFPIQSYYIMIQIKCCKNGHFENRKTLRDKNRICFSLHCTEPKSCRGRHVRPAKFNVSFYNFDPLIERSVSRTSVLCSVKWKTHPFLSIYKYKFITLSLKFIIQIKSTKHINQEITHKEHIE